jgi:hypothetical protein
MRLARDRPFRRRIAIFQCLFALLASRNATLDKYVAPEMAEVQPRNARSDGAARQFRRRAAVKASSGER